MRVSCLSLYHIVSSVSTPFKDLIGLNTTVFSAIRMTVPCLVFPQAGFWPQAATNALANGEDLLEMCKSTTATPQPPHRAARSTLSQEK